jgi:copper oxidase (laccase) domain-containing protein
VFLQQVHGACEALHAHTTDGAAADACVSDQPGAVCTIMVADCLPVLLAHRHVPVVAAAHAGWRGLVGKTVWAYWRRCLPFCKAGTGTPGASGACSPATCC